MTRAYAWRAKRVPVSAFMTAWVADDSLTMLCVADDAERYCVMLGARGAHTLQLRRHRASQTFSARVDNRRDVSTSVCMKSRYTHRTAAAAATSASYTKQTLCA